MILGMGCGQRLRYLSTLYGDRQPFLSAALDTPRARSVSWSAHEANAHIHAGRSRVEAQNRSAPTLSTQQGAWCDEAGLRSLPVKSLFIVVGSGAHSFQGQPVCTHGPAVRRAVEAILERECIFSVKDPKNKGSIVVPRTALKQYLRLKHEESCCSQGLHASGMQSVLVSLGVSFALASAYLIPVVLYSSLQG